MINPEKKDISMNSSKTGPIDPIPESKFLFPILLHSFSKTTHLWRLLRLALSPLQTKKKTIKNPPSSLDTEDEQKKLDTFQRGPKDRQRRSKLVSSQTKITTVKNINAKQHQLTHIYTRSEKFRTFWLFSFFFFLMFGLFWWVLFFPFCWITIIIIGYFSVLGQLFPGSGTTFFNFGWFCIFSFSLCTWLALISVFFFTSFFFKPIYARKCEILFRLAKCNARKKNDD